MFRRRTRPSLARRLRNHLWPHMGLRRTITLYWLRLQRIPASPTSIAAGFALGLAVSFSPILGSHMILAALIAWAAGVSAVAALIGTAMLNPWTAPPAWFATYYVGRLLEGAPILGKANAPKFVAMFKGLTESVLTLNFDLFVGQVWPVFKPMLLGSIPIGIAAGLTSYWLLVPMLAGLRHRRSGIDPGPPVQTV